VSREKQDEAAGLQAWVVRSSSGTSGGHPVWTVVDTFVREGRAYIVACRQPAPTGVATLTEREREVLSRLASGETTKEAAFALGISDATVRVLLRRAVGKLGATSRRELLGRPEVQRLRGNG
jgi:DNA-binding NarL/FixJ family response regulator